MEPQRVCIKKAELNKRGISSLLEWKTNTHNHYIGRNLTYYVSGATGSIYANPFSLRKYSRERSLQLYEEHLRNRTDLMERIEEVLEWEELGCWCLPDEDCHGDVLLRVAKEKKENK